MSVFDTLYLVVFVFVIAISGILISITTAPIASALQPILNTTVGGNQSIGVMTSATDSLDFIIVAIAFGSMLFAVVSAWMINSHPVFIFPAIIFGAISLFIAPFIANTFGGFITDPAIAPTVNAKFPMTTSLFQYYPYFILGAFILVALMTLGKPAERG